MKRSLPVIAAVVGLTLAAGCSAVTEGTASAGDSPFASASAPVPSPAAVAGCDPAVIADDLGRPQSQALLGQCLGDWALMDNGGQYGDTDYLARRVSGRWVTYTSFPTMICRDDAESDGVPDDWLTGFNDCAPPSAPAAADLGLSTPISSPACDGSAIVILQSAVDPDNYARDVQRALASNPGASYLRTDKSCPSLNPTDAQGNLIYAVYLPAGRDRSDICRELGRAPAESYAKVMDTTTAPGEATISC